MLLQFLAFLNGMPRRKRSSKVIKGLSNEYSQLLKYIKDPNLLVFTAAGGLGPVDFVTLNLKTGKYNAYDVKSKNFRKSNYVSKQGHNVNYNGKLINRPLTILQKKLNVKIIYGDE